MNDLDIDLARNTPWVDMSACVKFGLDRPSRLAGHTEQINRHNAFYYTDALFTFLIKKTESENPVHIELYNTIIEPDICDY